MSLKSKQEDDEIPIWDSSDSDKSNDDENSPRHTGNERYNLII
jgi:hypothetical protein